MKTLVLVRDGIEARLSPAGGRILGLSWRRDGSEPVPLLCEATEGARPDDRSAFPLVPFCNRLESNTFSFEGRTHRLAPNSTDPHTLHGDGWLGSWTIEAAADAAVTLSFRYDAGPYVYEARQDVRIEGGAFHLALSVENQGAAPMPFGLGWHPFLPRTPLTRLELRAETFRAERPGHLPGELTSPPPDLDFSASAPLPARWVNNGLEDWDGQARILWPEQGTSLAISADPVFAHAFLFLPDGRLAPALDWFCLEPMTHRAGAHHHADGGDLVVLQPGESLAGAIRLTPSPLESLPS